MKNDWNILMMLSHIRHIVSNILAGGCLCNEIKTSDNGLEVMMEGTLGTVLRACLGLSCVAPVEALRRFKP